MTFKTPREMPSEHGSHPISLAISPSTSICNSTSLSPATPIAHVKAVLNFNTARTFVLKKLASKSRNYTNVHFL